MIVRLRILLMIFFTPGLAFAGPLDQLSSFGYQLQNIDPTEISASPFDLVVVDYSQDGSDAEAFTPAEVTQMQSGGRFVVSYFSIGEAEEYRYYFRRRWVSRTRGADCGRRLTDRAPSWLDDPNPNWCGNYKVRYWQRAWKRILFGVQSGRRKSYLDRIIDAGFDGIYLDIVDAFEYRKFIGERGGRRRTAKAMANLVIALSRYARETRGLSDFVVIPQNGSAIIEYLPAAKLQQYYDAIDAIGAEDTFYFGDADEDNDLNEQTYAIGLLEQFVAAGKQVLAIDYLTDTAKIADFTQRACSHGFIPQVATRDLGDLLAQTVQGCD